MTQGELEELPQPFAEILSELEARIMKDIVERIRANGFSSATSDWEISRLQQLGESEENIRKWIKETLQKTDEEIDRIFSNDVYREYYGHERAYQLAGMKQIPLEQNLPLQTLIEAARSQTKRTFRNMTASMGFAIRNPVTGQTIHSPTIEFYQKTLDAAMMDIHSGAFSYNTVLQRTIDTLTNSGLRWIDYDSGHHDRVDVAARRAIMTGFRQVQGKINEQAAEQLQTDSYEVTYHVGARPTHQPWQGRVWTYNELVSVCGLGTGPGLHGWNCYHDYRPFIPGVSVRTYTDEQLDQMIAEENTPKEYNGKQYTTYEALQAQRRMERNMRKTRQDIRLLQSGEADPKSVILKKAKYQGQMQTYKDFSKAMKLPEQMDRVYQDGLRGRFTPTRSEQKKLEQSVINDKIKAELSAVNIKGVPNINPDKVDVSKFSFDDAHINGERAHRVTREEAEQFVKEADISLTRWNGRFINYYGPNGAAYIDVENKSIRTSFKKEQFDEQTLKIREVVEKYGSKKD